MIQVWTYDENKVFVESIFVDEVTQNMTTIPFLVGYIKPTFNEELEEWFEGATEEEIKAWEEENKPKPQEPNEVEVLTARVDGLENINAGLLFENAEHQIKIQEQEKMNKEQEVTNANLLLEIAMLKGAML